MCKKFVNSAMVGIHPSKVFTHTQSYPKSSESYLIKKAPPYLTWKENFLKAVSIEFGMVKIISQYVCTYYSLYHGQYVAFT